MGLRTPLLLAVAIAAATQSAAQTTVRSAHLYADLSPDDDGAEVRIEYVLDVVGSPTLRFELLGFGAATADGFLLGERSNGVPIIFESETGSMRATEFTLSLADSGEGYRVVGNYWIEAAVERTGEDVRVHVPVLSLAFPPADGVPDLFTAELSLPPGWAVSEGFPSGLGLTEDSTYAVELAVVPSVVSLRARTDGSWRPGLPFVIDVFMGLFLLVFSFFGWRHLRGVAAAGRAT